MRDSLQRGGRGCEIPSREEEDDEQLADFLAKHKRADDKAVTCKLAPSMIKIYLSGLSNTFLRLHKGVRDVAKVGLVAYERLGTADRIFESYEGITLQDRLLLLLLPVC